MQGKRQVGVYPVRELPLSARSSLVGPQAGSQLLSRSVPFHLLSKGHLELHTFPDSKSYKARRTSPNRKYCLPQL